MCIHEGGVSGYYSDPWNILGTFQMILFLIDTITWLVRAQLMRLNQRCYGPRPIDEGSTIQPCCGPRPL